MKKIILLLFISIALFCTSCLQKGGFALVEGNIYKQGTNEPISGTDIYLLRTHNGNQGEYIKATTSDENGYYMISYYYKFNSDYRYYVQIKPKGSSRQEKQMNDLEERYDFYIP